MKKIKTFILMLSLLTFTIVGFSAPTYAYNATKAVKYADTYVSNPNSAYRKFTFDCTNFVSQIMHAGGLNMNGNWYYNGRNDYSRTWTIADDLKNYLKNNYGATRLSDGWTKNGTYHGSIWLYPYINNSSNIPTSGDVVIFYDWEDDGIIDHASYCVGTGYATSETTLYGDLINQHTKERVRELWHLDKFNTHRATTAIYAFRL